MTLEKILSENTEALKKLAEVLKKPGSRLEDREIQKSKKVEEEEVEDFEDLREEVRKLANKKIDELGIERSKIKAEIEKCGADRISALDGEGLEKLKLILNKKFKKEKN